jgi:hypothetical protein
MWRLSVHLVSIIFLESLVLASEEGHCQVDGVERCGCRVYNEEEMKTSPSLITYFPMGRLGKEAVQKRLSLISPLLKPLSLVGNTISAYLTLLWLKMDHGLDVYFDRSSFATMRLYFDNVGGGIKVLEDHLCRWEEFKFFNFEEDIQLLATDQWKIGKAINIHPDTEEVRDAQGVNLRDIQNEFGLF